MDGLEHTAHGLAKELMQEWRREIEEMQARIVERREKSGMAVTVEMVTTPGRSRAGRVEEGDGAVFTIARFP